VSRLRGEPREPTPKHHALRALLDAPSPPSAPGKPKLLDSHRTIFCRPGKINSGKRLGTVAPKLCAIIFAQRERCVDCCGKFTVKRAAGKKKFMAPRSRNKERRDLRCSGVSSTARGDPVATTSSMRKYLHWGHSESPLIIINTSRTKTLPILALGVGEEGKRTGSNPQSPRKSPRQRPTRTSPCVRSHQTHSQNDLPPPYNQTGQDRSR
jgi:hypothetical protein